MTDRTETPREENTVYMDMDSGDARKESIEGSDAMSLQGAENSQHNHVEDVISHNKPKKDANLHVIPQDYVCIPRDITIIESIKSAPKNTQFVDIGDALLATDDLECLIRNDMFLHDGVINAYIYCMLAHDHLQDRAGEKLFIPINMPGYHWYLAVANAKKREIQVLDSLGENVKRNDLATTLLGLEKWLKLVEHSPEFIKGHKWPDLNVTKWTVVEQIQEAIQTDGVSCGLFMLNYMEYWTPHGLSDQFTQEDMKHFRQKLAIILLDSELNKLKGCPMYHQPLNEETLANSDLEILDNPSDVVEDKRPAPITIIPTDQREILVGLCNYIMSINDAGCLEKSMLLESTRGQKFCEKETIQTLATLFDSWPGMETDISSCNKLHL
uniref:Ubiquitin-like protease family profile domain-containing protein n=1 Tax=Aegilops tauschii TaxID=37682 RepID=M8CUD5_AEGTA